MRIVCISDTHSLHRRIPEIPDGDVLIHAGDCLGAGTLDNVEDLNDWLGTLPHRHKIVIAGNHDWVFQEAPKLARDLLTNAVYLEDSGIEIEVSAHKSGVLRSKTYRDPDCSWSRSTFQGSSASICSTVVASAMRLRTYPIYADGSRLLAFAVSISE